MATKTAWGSIELDSVESILFQDFQRLVDQGVSPPKAASLVMNEGLGSRQLEDRGGDPVDFERHILLGLDEKFLHATRRTLPRKTEDPYLPPILSFCGKKYDPLTGLPAEDTPKVKHVEPGKTTDNPGTDAPSKTKVKKKRR